MVTRNPPEQTIFPIQALILAGGNSSRMGEDKAWIEYHGLPQIIWLYELLEKHGLKVWISLQETDDRLKQFRCCTDLPALAGHGPVSGVLSAIHEAGKDTAWLLIGCDYPLFNEKEIQHLLAKRNPAALATVFTAEDRILPFPAILEPAMLDQLEADFNESMASLSQSLNRRAELLQVIAPLSPHALQSIDTPEEKARLLLTIKGQTE